MTENFNPRVTEGEVGYLAARLASALGATFISPNELDRNLEPANVVDGLFAIAQGLHHVARAIERSQGLSPNDPVKS